MPYNSEEMESMDPTIHMPTLEPTCMTLDTIQEAKESSSLSGESEEHLEIISQTELDSVPELKDEKKIKVQWMNDDEEEEEDDTEDDDRLQELYIQQMEHPDIDGGWAWVVFVANFLIFILSSGLLASTGLYYVQMLVIFNKSRSVTAWMGSLMNAFYMLAGPISSVIIKKWGCRTSIILGGLIMTTGYLICSLAQSLAFILFTYGIVVACGMNFVYSGQIISLAQSFQKYHSGATSFSMVGIGIGMFMLIRVLDVIILEYGWQISFIACAAISLQICVLGSLVFPLKPLKEGEEEKNAPNDYMKECFSQESIPMSPVPLGKMLLNKRAFINRSVSSLRLSIGAGYLSSSFSNLNGDVRSGNSTIGSNQHSFCSRGSQYLGGVRSNQHSFSQFQNGDIPVGFLPFLRSNQHSFCSRGSSYAIHSLKSNPQSFSIKNSQMDLHHIAYHHNLPMFKGIDIDRVGKEKESLHMGSSKLFEPDQTKEIENELNRSKTSRLWRKIKNALNEIISNWHLDLMLDSCFWLMNMSMFFTMLATIKLFVIYKDLSEFLGFGDYYSIAMSIIGMGDMLGRVSGGILSSYKWVNSTLLYAMAILLCGIVIALHLVVSSGPAFLVVAGLFGFFYGQQNVLITLVPSFMFGKEMLVTVFGYILFFAGMGAMAGAPLAGYIVDRTGSYNGVIILSVSSCALGGVCLLFCHLISSRRLKMKRNLSNSSV